MSKNTTKQALPPQQFSENDPKALCKQANAILDKVDALLESAYQKHSCVLGTPFDLND